MLVFRGYTMHHRLCPAREPERDPLGGSLPGRFVEVNRAGEDARISRPGGDAKTPPPPVLISGAPLGSGQHQPAGSVPTANASARPFRESGWPRTVALCTGDGSIAELPPLLHAPEQDTAATHVAATDERRREEEPVPEDLEERLDVTGAGHAAEQDEPAARAGEHPQRLRVAAEWRQVARPRGLHPDLGVLAKPADRHALRGIAQALARRDDESAAEARRRTAEGVRIGELPPEVE